MQTKYINEMLDLPELQIHPILSIDTKELHIRAVPIGYKQCCSICQSDQNVIRKGNNGLRTVRHLPVFAKKIFLYVPAIRWYCTACEAGFGWSYEFVEPKQRYSKLFRSHTIEQTLGSTAAQNSFRVPGTSKVFSGQRSHSRPLWIPRRSGMMAPTGIAFHNPEMRFFHMNKPSLYGLTFDQLTAWLTERGFRKSRAALIWEWLYRKRVTSFTDMTDVDQACLQALSEHFTIGTLTEHTQQISVYGTVKFLFRLQDGNLIETVLMRHGFGLSVCVTTQVGCNIGCSFCASGLLAKSRDLSAGEIVEQIMQVQLYLDRAGKGEKVTHVVVMGIGEPFDNMKNLRNFILVIKDPKGLAIGPRHITVSTSGLADKLKEFADDDLGVNLAVSLHAPNNELRSRIMKINRAYPIERLMEAVDYFLAKTNRRVTLEYILLKDVNDRPEHALELAELVGNRRRFINVNLIPYNPVDEHSQYQRSTPEAIRIFFDTLKKQGVKCTTRTEHGADIDAACGQLRSKQIRKLG